MADGDESALRTLYIRFSPALQAVTYRILQDRADTEEVVAESFAQAWREAVRFHGNRGSVAAWLTTIARSRAIDAVRARRRREEMTDRASQTAPDIAPGLGTEIETADERAEANERRTHVRHAMSVLSHEQRQAIELAFFDGRSHSEIATQLDVPLGTIKTRIRSGMQRLRDGLRHLFADMTNE